MHCVESEPTYNNDLLNSSSTIIFLKMPICFCKRDEFQDWNDLLMPCIIPGGSGWDCQGSDKACTV